MDVKYLQLWDWYKNLLTPTQQEITELYFNCDLSFGEIAEQKGITRQSVSDAITKSKRSLDGFEDKLRFVEYVNKFCEEESSKMTNACRALAALKDKYPHLSDELDEIIKTIEGDDAVRAD